MTSKCIHCGVETPNPKFCSRSCSNSHNSKGVRRHGNPPNNCLICGSLTKNSKRKYCSPQCAGVGIGSARKTWSTEEERKALQRHRFMAYYAKKRNQTPPDADMGQIKNIYLNCPDGHEVDHIIPISKGGLHHQDNLQYLTIRENRSKGNKLDWCAR